MKPSNSGHSKYRTPPNIGQKPDDRNVLLPNTYKKNLPAVQWSVIASTSHQSPIGQSKGIRTRKYKRDKKNYFRNLFQISSGIIFYLLILFSFSQYNIHGVIQLLRSHKMTKISTPSPPLLALV